MTALEFIFGVIVVLAVVFIVIGYTGVKYDNKKLKEEIETLKKKNRGGNK